MPLLHGQDPSDVMLPLQVTADGYLRVVLEPGDAGLGYADDKTQQVVDADTAAGTVTIESDAVTAGEIWDVQAVLAYNSVSAVTSVFLHCLINGVQVGLLWQGSPAVSTPDIWTGKITLSEGDKVRATFAGCSLHDSVVLRFHAVVRDRY
jgi:hypothetical protein